MKSYYNLSHLSIASWNVHGLGKKASDPKFLKEINKHHIIALVETHGSDDKPIAIEGYYAYQVNRSKAHGGIAFIIKKELRHGVKFYPAQTSDMLWVCLKKEFFKLQADMSIGAVYIPLVNSSYARKLEYDIFECVEEEICKYTSQGQTIVMGDFNARSSTIQDYVSDSGVHHLNVSCDIVFDSDFLPRNSQDNKVKQCKYGKQLIDMCISTGLKIANGRVFGDPCGNFTCHQYNGSSVVDYLLADNVTITI